MSDKKIALPTGSKKEEEIFNDMLSLYDDAEQIILTLKNATTFDRITNFERMEHLLTMLESNVQSLIDAYVSFLSLHEKTDRNAVKKEIRRSLKDIVGEIKKTRKEYQ